MGGPVCCQELVGPLKAPRNLSLRGFFGEGSDAEGGYFFRGPPLHRRDQV